MDKVDKIMDEVSLNKDDTQEDKIDESVKETLQKMGWLWDRLENKFKEDGVCFQCKCKLEAGTNPGFVMEASGVDSGVYAVVMLCNKCYSEAQAKGTSAQAEKELQSNDEVENNGTTE